MMEREERKGHKRHLLDMTVVTFVAEKVHRLGSWNLRVFELGRSE